MLSQFCSRYPHGSLVSELVQIDHGKYIVRVSVILEGKTLTGLASANTVEAAEDQARLRALALLPEDAAPPQKPRAVSQAVKPLPEKPPQVAAPLTLVPPTPVEPEPLPAPADLTLVPPTPVEPEPLPAPADLEDLMDTPLAEPIPEEVIPAAIPLSSEGMDFNQVMAQIDVEMKRLQWTKEQGRDYLRSTYGKTSRIQLNDTEIFEFLTYLKTQS
jgi:hypothetical protein